MASIQGNILRGHLEMMILACLERGEAHGFDILKRLEEAGNGALNLKEGTLYPALYRLEEGGAVKARWEEDTGRRGPRRRIYVLTPKGRKRLASGREEWSVFTQVIGGIMEKGA